MYNRIYHLYNWLYHWILWDMHHTVYLHHNNGWRCYSRTNHSHHSSWHYMYKHRCRSDMLALHWPLNKYLHANHSSLHCCLHRYCHRHAYLMRTTYNCRHCKSYLQHILYCPSIRHLNTSAEFFRSIVSHHLYIDPIHRHHRIRDNRRCM